MSAQKTVMVESLDDFVRMLGQWHQRQVAVIKHMMDVPDGTEVTETDDNTGEPIKADPLVLTGEARRGFILGLKVALNELGTMPFEVEFEPAPTAEEQGQQALELGTTEPAAEAPAVTH